jgi:hypothetical protein
MLESDVTYLQKVRRKITDIIRTPVAFCDLVEQCEGAYPQTVKRMLDRLVQKGVASERGGAFQLVSASPPVATKSVEEAIGSECQAPEVVLPEPHPADYDWRFTRSTRCRLTEHVKQAIGPNGRVALLGTPTLLSVMSHNGLRPLLIERNDVLLKVLEREGYGEQLLNHDLFLPMPLEQRGEFEAIVADPPWYSPFEEAFLLRASECAKSGSLAFVSLPPDLTRPHVAEEKEHILRFAKETGLAFMQSEPGFLRYETPEFERVSLLREGIECLNWRSGDLVSLARTEDPALQRETPRPDEEPVWRDYWLDGLRIKIRLPLDDGASRFQFEKIALADMDAVSRRSPIRGRINVWTSRNGAYRVDRVAIVDALLRRIGLGAEFRDAMAETGADFGLSPTERTALETFVRSLNE